MTFFRERPKKGRSNIFAKIWHPRFLSPGSASVGLHGCIGLPYDGNKRFTGKSPQMTADFAAKIKLFNA